MSIRMRTLVTCIALALVAVSGGFSCAAARADETVDVCGLYPNDVFQHQATFGISAKGGCPSGQYGNTGLGVYANGNRVPRGTRGNWQANAPGGLAIVGATIPQNDLFSAGLNDGQQWGGGFYWAGGGAQTTDGEPGATLGGFSSSYFGFQLVCGANPCTNGTSQINVGALTMDVRETQGPQLVAPDGLWQQSGWVRSNWPVHFYGDSASGLCSLSASLNGQALAGSTSSGVNSATWHQCAAPAYDTTVNTASYGQGAVPLVLNASDAAGVPASTSKTVYIDNSTPSLTLSGPVDAPTTAGTQYITASAGGSPSGIADIACSVDGRPQTFASATAQVPVSGIGQHTLSCTAYDSAVDAAGNHGASQTETWSIKIGEPTILGVAFQKLVGLRCHRTLVRKTVPGHRITVRRHGKRVRIKTRPHTKLVKVTRCHPRTIRKRTVVYVPVRRHGKIVKVKRVKYVRVVVPPHIVSHTKKHVRYGHRTSVSGFLGTADGTALPGHVVRVLTAPSNGLGQFSQVAAVTTAADGTWTAKLPRGPSRIIEAVYDGDPVTESTSSGQVRVTVPAKIKLLSVSPKQVAWGHAVRITGRLLGGYLPAGGVNLRLRIGIGRNRATYGVQEHVAGNGHFSTTYTFGAGYPSIHRRYWFEIATLPSGNYPYAPSASNRQYVLVGGHPRTTTTTPTHRKHHRGHHHKRSHHRKRHHRKHRH